MNDKPLTSRADLVRWIAHCKAIKADQWQEEIAIMLGYQWQPEQIISTEVLDKLPPESTKESNDQQDNETSVERKIRPAELFYYLAYHELHRTKEEALNNVPTGLQQVSALNDADLESQKKPQPFFFQPLLSNQRLSPFFAYQLRHQQGEKLDVDRLVKQLSQHKPLVDIPTIPCLLPAGNVTVFIDLSERLLPFWQDIHVASDLIKKIHGHFGLDMRVLVTDDPMGAYVAYDHWLSKRLKRQQWKTIPPQSEVLILSDLGQLLPHQQCLKQQWLRLLQHLSKRGITPTILAPIGTVHQCSRIQSLSQQVLWHKQSSLVPQKPSTYYVEHRRNVERVLGLLSMTPHIETMLLRTLLTLLPIREAHSGVEADVYLHPDVQWGYRVIVMRGGKREKYQHIFAQEEPVLQQAVLQCIKQYHQGQFPAVWYETVLNAEPLVAFPLEKIADITQARTFMQRFAKRTLQQKQHTGMVQYAARNLARLSSQQRKQYSEDFTSVLYGLSHQHEVLTGEAIPEEYNVDIVQQVVQTSGVQKTIYVLQVGAYFYLSDQSPERLASNGVIYGQVIARFTTQQNTIRVERQIVMLKDETLIPLTWEKPHHSLTIDTGHETLVLSAISKPSWAKALRYQNNQLVVILALAGTEYIGTPFYEGVTDSSNKTNYVQHWRARHEDEHTIGFDDDGIYADLVIAGITQRFRWIEPTTFIMGSPKDEAGRYDDETQHQVTLTQGYWLADTTVTQAFWQAVMGENPSYFTAKETGLSSTEQHPVEKVSWDDCQRFISTLKQKFPALNARLPSEAEWENACRAGTQTPFNFAEEVDLTKVNYSGKFNDSGYEKEALQRTATVKSYPSNAWGLYEMHGNVWEWCQDFWVDDLGAEAATDPAAEEEGSHRVLRGGSWYDFGRFTRSAMRHLYSPDSRRNLIGLRLALGQPS